MLFPGIRPFFLKTEIRESASGNRRFNRNIVARPGSAEIIS